MPNDGPIGQERGVALGIFLYFITLGIYGLYWTYMTFDEIKRHTRQGLGGGLGLLVCFLTLGIATHFIAPNEVKNMYESDGREAPLSAVTGFWMFFPILGNFIWFSKVQGSLNTYWQLKKLAITSSAASSATA
jgi:uncharacterized protein DUF4234